MQPPPLCRLRAEALDRMLSERPSTVVRRAPPPPSFSCVIGNVLFLGSPFPITSNLTFSLLKYFLKRSSASSSDAPGSTPHLFWDNLFLRCLLSHRGSSVGCG